MLIILGPFRSGTSLVSAVLAELGADFGRRADHYPPANRLNPLGYFQLRAVVAANRQLLRRGGVSLGAPPGPEELRQAVDPDVLRLALGDTVLPGAIKDPRLSLTLACWFDAGIARPETTRLVVVDRPTEAIVRSVLGHREVAGYCGNSIEGARAMTEGLRAGARWHAALPGVDALTVRYEDVVRDPAGSIARLASWLGTADPERQQRAAALVGRSAALRRHYLRKALRPGDVALTLWKSLRTRLG